MLGIIGKKVGMTQVYKDGHIVPVTVIESRPCKLVHKKTLEKNGYSSLALGIGDVKEKKVNKPLKGMFDKLGLKPVKFIKEFRTADVANYEIGQDIDLDILKDTAFVDVSGFSIGRGFQGVMKRHGFGGGPASHGSSLFHRGSGSIGSNTFPAKVIKGLKMAGHMGNRKITVQNLKVIKLDKENNLLLIKGAIPGPKNSYVLVKPSVKKARRES